ncbi:hypothetical protein COOONC_24752 [Cooperia oncophora]
MLAVDFGLKSQQEAEIRQRLITILDRDYKAGKTVSLQQLHQECENFLSLKRDSEVVAGTMKLVEATSVQKRKEIECWNCEGNHRASGCQAKPWFCKKCRKANSSRVYIDAVVNNYSVKFLLDTGSDITLLNEKITNIVVKNASGDTMKIYGKLKCKITMKGVTTEGDAYVTPHNSLLGLEWIRANENLMYHIEMMAAEVKANCNPRREEELKKTFPDVFEEGVGRCTKEKVDTLKRGFRNLKGEEKPSEDKFNVILQAHRTTPHRCLEDRTESSTRLYAEENRRKMKQQYDRRNGSISKEFHKGDDVYAQMWKAPHSTWKQGVVAKRLGKVNYEVPVEGRLMRKHANQLRHSNTGTRNLLNRVTNLDDNRPKKQRTAALHDFGHRSTVLPEPSLRRSTRIRRPVNTLWH